MADKDGTANRSRLRFLKGKPRILIAAAAVVVALPALYVGAQDLHRGHHGGGHHGGSHGDGMHGGMGAHHGADGAGHDEVNMPGLRGLNVSDQETEEMAAMFRQFEGIERTVENLPNGIKTVTFSKDPDLMGIIASHAIGMIRRVEKGNDPKVFIQSPTLDIFFERAHEIETVIDMTDEGLVIIQTSNDPEMVEALHTHAAEVTAMAERGMEAVHDMMAERAKAGK